MRQASTSSEDEDNVVHGTFYRAKCATHAARVGAPSHLSRVLQQRSMCLQQQQEGRSSSHPSRLFRSGSSTAPVTPVTTHTLHLESTGRKTRSRLSVHPQMDSEDDGEEEEEEEEEIIGLNLDGRSPLSNLDPSNLPCNCSDPGCRQQQDHISRQGCSRRDSSTPFASSSPLYASLHAEGTPAQRVRARLIAAAGGEEEAQAVYQRFLELFRKQPEISPSTISGDGDTLLMQLLSRASTSLGDRLEASSGKLLTGQVVAFVRIYLEVGQGGELLFVRNAAGYSALELAALANQPDVAEYLLRLYRPLGRDPNDSNVKGHTVLHVMARKGDDAADTLERLLALRSDGAMGAGARLLRYDVVNSGGKTPLDVACACEQLFSTGAERTLYAKVIRLFHETIKAEAKEIFGEEAHFSSGSECSRSNSLSEAMDVEAGAANEGNPGLTFTNF